MIFYFFLGISLLKFIFGFSNFGDILKSNFLNLSFAFSNLGANSFLFILLLKFISSFSNFGDIYSISPLRPRLISTIAPSKVL